MPDLTIGQVADLLGVTRQTIHNWLKNIGYEFFSENATRVSGKRFPPDDIEQLRTIKGLLEMGKRYEQIPDLINTPQVFDVVDDIPKEQPDQQEPSNAIQLAEYFDQLLKMLEQQQQNHQVSISAKDETIQILKSENERLRQDLERARQPWWKRL